MKNLVLVLVSFLTQTGLSLFLVWFVFLFFSMFLAVENANSDLSL